MTKQQAKQKRIEVALWGIRNLAHQTGLYVESILLDLGLMEYEQRIFLTKKERTMGQKDAEVHG